MNYNLIVNDSKPFYLKTPSSTTKSTYLTNYKTLSKFNTFTNYDSNYKQYDHIRENVISKSRTTLPTATAATTTTATLNNNNEKQISNSNSSSNANKEVKVYNDEHALTLYSSNGKNEDYDEDNDDYDENILDDIEQQIKENEIIYKQSKLIRKKFDRLVSKSSYQLPSSTTPVTSTVTPTATTLVKRAYSLQNYNKNQNLLPFTSYYSNDSQISDNHNNSSININVKTNDINTNKSMSTTNTPAIIVSQSSPKTTSNNNNNNSITILNNHTELHNNNNNLNDVSTHSHSNTSEFELIELINDVKNKSKELAESEKVVKENNSQIESNKKKIQVLELKLLELEKDTNEYDKNEFKYLISYNNKITPYDSQVNSVKDKYLSYNSDMKFSNSYKDLYAAPLMSISRDTGNMRKDINKLRFEIDGLKFDNSKLTIKTNALESRINELQCDIGGALRKSERIQKYVSHDDKCYSELKSLLEEIRNTKLMFRNNNSIYTASPVTVRNSYQRDFDSKYNRSNFYLNSDKQMVPLGATTTSYASFMPSYLNNYSSANKSYSRGFRNSTEYLTSQSITPNTISPSYLKSIDYKDKSSSAWLVPQNDSYRPNQTYQSSLYRNEKYDSDPKYGNTGEYRLHNYAEKENTYQSPIKVDTTHTSNATFHSPKNKDLYLESQSFLVNSKPLLKSELNIKNNEQVAEDTEKQLLKADYEKLKDECTKAHNENRELKKKIFDIEKVSIDKRKHAELWQTMYNRILNYLPDKEAELVKMSAELEKINIMTDNLDDSYEGDSAEILNSVREIRKIDQENVRKQRETLKTMISKLNEENTSLRIQLEHTKETNTTEQQKLTEYSNENAHLKRELHNLKKLQVQEANKTVNEVQIKNELENLKLKLDFEINEKEQLKKKYDAELHATKVRCDNEILRQNQIMQEKYDNFVFEINKLSREIKELKDERNTLIALIEKEKNTNRDLLAQLGIKRTEPSNEAINHVIFKFDNNNNNNNKHSSFNNQDSSFGVTNLTSIINSDANKSLEDGLNLNKESFTDYDNIKHNNSQNTINLTKSEILDSTIKTTKSNSFSSTLCSSYLANSGLMSSSSSLLITSTMTQPKSFKTLPWDCSN